MKSNQSFLLIGIVALLISACSAEKRHYRAGYHITWKKTRHAVEQVHVAQQKSKVKTGEH